MSHPFYQTVLNSAKAAFAKKNNLVLAGSFSSALGIEDKSDPTESLEPFTTGGLGNFPYYWKDPRNNLFNIETYNWISANVKANTYPIEQDTGSTFTNLSIQALGSVSYGLSTTDQNALEADSIKIFNAQSQLLIAWEKAYGSIPPSSSTQQPVDKVITVIATTWASPPTTFEDMLNTTNLAELLNEVPPSGRPVMPILDIYMNAINTSTSLQMASPSQSGYLNAALKALQEPSLANGGLETNIGKVLPAYEVTTPLATILEGLNNSSNRFRVPMKITKSSKNKIFVETASEEGFKIDVDSFFAMPDLSEQNILTFNQSLKKYWFWKEPLIQSVQDIGKDITGFKFSPIPLIDFSTNGPYGFLTAVAISNYPNIYLKLPEHDYKNVAESVRGFSGELRLMGNTMKSQASPTPFKCKTSVMRKDRPVELVLSPDAEHSPNVHSRAYVHGVLVDETGISTWFEKRVKIPFPVNELRFIFISRNQMTIRAKYRMKFTPLSCA